MDKRVLEIEGHRIGDSTMPYVIAEIGHNHQGSLELCKEIIDAAIKSGASAGKIQRRNNATIFTRQFYNSVYASSHAYGPTYGGHREALEFSKTQTEQLIRYARARDFTLFATAFDEGSADDLAEIGAAAIKIASGDLTNTPLLRHVARLGLPVLVSTGGGTMLDVRRAYDIITSEHDRLCLFQCTANYPPAPHEVNLSVIGAYRTTFPDVVVGLSDHTLDDTTAIAAVALGARVIEKHFTTNRRLKGSDQALSLDPPAMRAMVKRLNVLCQSLGDGIKRRYPGEERGLAKMAKALVAKTALPLGHVITPEDLIAKTPPDGCPPNQIDLFLGRRLCTRLEADEAISAAHVQQTKLHLLRGETAQHVAENR